MGICCNRISKQFGDDAVGIDISFNVETKGRDTFEDVFVVAYYNTIVVCYYGLYAGWFFTDFIQSTILYSVDYFSIYNEYGELCIIGQCIKGRRIRTEESTVG